MTSPLSISGGTSIRETIHELDRADTNVVVAVDNESVLGTVTRTRLRREITSGLCVDQPLSSVFEDVSVSDTSTDTNHSRETVLVIGGAGYLGSVCCRELLDRGFAVRVLDALLFGDDGIADMYGHDHFSLLQGDMRSVGTLVDAIDGVDAVIHLGGIVGDPSCEMAPQKTLEYNYHAAVLAASICQYHQVNRFVFASTCSVYGKSATPAQPLTETDSLNPVSLYAKTKIDAEGAICELADENFSPTIFRLATVYGQSPRMRFDLVGNILPAKAYTAGTVPVFGGDQFRPHIHVGDVARAFSMAIETPIDAVAGEVFNVGSSAQNYRIIELANRIKDAFPEATIDRQHGNEDERSYCVDFKKIRQTLGFEPVWTIERHCQDIQQAFETGLFEPHTADRYHNVRWLQPSLLEAASARKSEASQSALDLPTSTDV